MNTKIKYKPLELDPVNGLLKRYNQYVDYCEEHNGTTTLAGFRAYLGLTSKEYTDLVDHDREKELIDSVLELI